MPYPIVTTGLTITKKTNQVLVTFGDYSDLLNAKKSSYNISSINFFELVADESFINVYVTGVGQYQLDMGGTKGMKVEDINGVTPTDNSNLLNLLSEI